MAKNVHFTVLVHFLDAHLATAINEIDTLDANLAELEKLAKHLDEYTKVLGKTTYPYIVPYPFAAPDIHTASFVAETKFKALGN